MRLAAVLEALAPHRCAACDAPGSPLCRTCARAIAALPQPGGAVAAAFPYVGPVRAVIHRGKFRDARSALRILADMAAERLEPPVDGIAVAVPLAAARRRSRGYNQAALLATVLAGHHDLEVAEFLTRPRETRAQSTLPANARRDNLAGAFAASPESAGRVVWLIDDVRTTGATTDAARAALEAAGAASVHGAVLAAVL